jgi:hypothetical protein
VKSSLVIVGGRNLARRLRTQISISALSISPQKPNVDDSKIAAALKDSCTVGLSDTLLPH